jgi:uronate dehydrogenase
MKRVLITGAEGLIGSVLRERLPDEYELRALTWRPVEGLESHVGDIADLEAIRPAFEGIDAVVQLAGHATMDATWEQALHSNIIGVRNVFEAARSAGVERVVFASSNHAVGRFENDGMPAIYRPGQTHFPIVDHRVPWRPDSLYGVSKAFGEDLSRYYYDRYGIETVCLRIGSSFPEVKDRRMLATFLSYGDLVELVRCAFFAPDVGHTIAFGMSNNSQAWWDNRAAKHLGFQARDSADAQRARVEAAQAPYAPDDPALVYQGGAFVRAGPFDE